MAHGILTPAALSHILAMTKRADAMHVHLALDTDAIRAMIDEITALRAHVLHLLPSNWDEQAEARDAIAHLRMTCGRHVTDALLLASGLVCTDPDPEPMPTNVTPEVIDPGDSEGGAA